MNAPDTPAFDLLSPFSAQRLAYAREPMPTYASRKDRLARLLALIEHHEGELADAISADFSHRSRHETLLAEIFVSVASIRHTQKHLRRWMRTQKMPTALHFRPAKNRLMRQPLGVVGVVSPWNYPVQLALVPVAAALAAGNRVMLKPSELTPATSALLASLVASHFAADEVTVIPGDANVGRAFVDLPFDHLLFTGSTAVGRHVAQAAARNLTPVTLELGGKSPAIVDPSADLARVVPSIVFGKLLNAGQTCIAPDYVLLPVGQEAAFEALAIETVRKMYPDLLRNPDYTAIVSERHAARLAALLDDARTKGARCVPLASAGEAREGRRMVPHLVFGATADMAIMQEEIFGPLLPVLPCADAQAAIAHINAHERPLALYWFGRDDRACQAVLCQTVSGGVTVNDTLWHISQEDQPFGGVGASGYGAYHGEAGFRTFSREKPVFYQSRLNGGHLFHPPYGARFMQLLKLLRRLV